MNVLKLFFTLTFFLAVCTAGAYNSPGHIAGAIGTYAGQINRNPFLNQINVPADSLKKADQAKGRSFKDSINRSRKNLIKLTPLKLRAPYYSGIEFSWEIKTSPHFSSQLSFCYLIPFEEVEYSDYPDFDTNLKGFVIAAEEKFYLKKTAPRGDYFALEVNYLNNQYHELVPPISIDAGYNDLSWLFPWGSSENSGRPEAEYRINQQTFSTSLKYGHQYIYRRFSLDLYIGLGLRYRDVNSSEANTALASAKAKRNKPPYNPDSYDASNWEISLPLNLRLGWLL